MSATDVYVASERFPGTCSRCGKVPSLHFGASRHCFAEDCNDTAASEAPRKSRRERLQDYVDGKHMNTASPPPVSAPDGATARRPVPTRLPGEGNEVINRWIGEWTAERRELEQAERERDQLRADLQAAREHERIAAEKINEARDGRDAAHAQCAAMREAFERFVKRTESITEDHPAYGFLVMGIPLVKAMATDAGKALLDRLAGAEAKAALLDTPEIHDFVRATVLEAAHQRARWGSDHDGGKTDADWFWLIGYLAGKALHNPTGDCKRCDGSGLLDCADPQCGDSTWDHNCTSGDPCPCGGPKAKQLHRIITIAAAAANWHAAKLGNTNMRPGIEPPTDES